jgi:HSP20 family protein
MDALIRWNAVRTMSLSDAVESFIADDWFNSMASAECCTADALALDVYETDDAFVVKASLPGVKPEDLDVHVEDNVLTVRGEAKEEEKVENARYHWQERWFGEFERSVRLPSQVAADKVEANLKDGVLTINVPKAEEAKPRKVSVNVK